MPGKAVGPVLNTVAIALICFFVFGIMAVQILGGRMMFCRYEAYLLYWYISTNTDAAPPSATCTCWIEKTASVSTRKLVLSLLALLIRKYKY